MTTLELAITPQRAALLAGHDNDLRVLVRVRAPAAATHGSPRRPLNLALVVDRSGSMDGQPLAEAKRCAEFIVDSLAADDHVALVTYDDHVRIAAPHQKVGDRAQLKQAIHEIFAGGMTALYDGWYQGAGQAALGTEEASLSRVLLLSDGQANVGLTDPPEIAQRCRDMADVGVTTSTYGLGRQFNEDLMIQMAQAGRGNSYYGQTAEDLLDPFREEFELLRALCARRLRLRLSAPTGIGVRVLNGYAQDADGRWQLPDLADGGEAWAAVSLRVPAEVGAAAVDGESVLLHASLVFEDIEHQVQQINARELRLPWLPQAAYGAVASDPLVAERFGELQAADLQEQARTAARNGDWARVDRLLARAMREAAEHPWLRRAVEVLQGYAAQRETESLAKEAMYSARRLRSRLADVNECPASYAPDEESAKASFLRRKVEQGKQFGDRPKPSDPGQA